jgi:hypothetical protein
MHADRGDLAWALSSARRHPDPGHALEARACEVEGVEGSDQSLLEVAHVALHVLPVVTKVEDRVADELARPVERGLAATVGLGDLDVGVLGDMELAVGLGPAADGDDRRMLQEEHGLRDRTLGDGTRERPLEVERLRVGHEPELQEVGTARHAVSVAAARVGYTRWPNIQRWPSGSSAV